MKSLCILMLLFPTLSLAQNIVIATDQLSKTQSEARLESLGGTSYANLMIQKLKARAKVQNIYARAVQLKEYELANNNEKIYQHCNEAFEIRHKADWSEGDRNYFVRCFKHLSHLSTDSRKKLALNLEIQAFKNRGVPISRIPIWIRDTHTWILINGKAFATSKNRIELPDTSFRMTLISNRFRQQSLIITKEEFKRLEPHKENLVSGSCENGFRYESKELDSYELKKAIVVSEHCHKALVGSHPIETQVAVKKPKAFKVPKWAWWVAGSVVGYALYENNKGSSNRSEPKTSKRGF